MNVKTSDGGEQVIYIVDPDTTYYCIRKSVTCDPKGGPPVTEHKIMNKIPGSDLIKDSFKHYRLFVKTQHFEFGYCKEDDFEVFKLLF